MIYAIMCAARSVGAAHSRTPKNLVFGFTTQWIAARNTSKVGNYNDRRRARGGGGVTESDLAAAIQWGAVVLIVLILSARR